MKKKLNFGEGVLRLVRQFLTYFFLFLGILLITDRSLTTTKEGYVLGVMLIFLSILINPVVDDILDHYYKKFPFDKRIYMFFSTFVIGMMFFPEWNIWNYKIGFPVFNLVVWLFIIIIKKKKKR